MTTMLRLASRRVLHQGLFLSPRLEISILLEMACRPPRQMLAKPTRRPPTGSLCYKLCSLNLRSCKYGYHWSVVPGYSLPVASPASGFRADDVIGELAWIIGSMDVHVHRLGDYMDTFAPSRAFLFTSHGRKRTGAPLIDVAMR